MIIRKTIDKVNEIYSKGYREVPSKVTRIAKSYEIHENCKIYDNLPDHLQNQQNLFKGLQGRPIESYEIYENCEIYDNSQDY